MELEDNRIASQKPNQTIQNFEQEQEQRPTSDHQQHHGSELQRRNLADGPIIERELVDHTIQMDIFGSLLRSKAERFQVGFKTTGHDKIVLKGAEEGVLNMMGLVNDIMELSKDPFTMKLLYGEIIQKQVENTKVSRQFTKEIASMAATAEVFVEVGHDIIQLVGYERKINEILAFIYEKEVNSQQGDIILQELNISTFHRVAKTQMKEMAEQLELKCEIGYDTIQVMGLQKRIDKMITYLLDLESQVKTKLFPKYWDFSQTNFYSLIPLDPISEEFQMVEGMFHATMKNPIVGVSRIQNKFVIDHYIRMLQKRMELNEGEVANRKLLFSKGNKQDPSTIYRNFDTGFDIQYGTNGTFGWGLYFSEQASVMAPDAFLAGNQNMQMIVADVFIGQPFQSPPTAFVKQPKGFDCIQSLSKSRKEPKIPLYVICSKSWKIIIT